MTVVQNILKIAKENKVNNQKLCQILNSNSNKIYDWKVGKSKPSTDELCILADYFNVSTDYLLGRTNKQTNNIIDNNVIQGKSSVALNGSVFNSGSISTSISTDKNKDLSEEETEIVEIYRSLNIRDKSTFLNFILNMEDKANKK